MSLFLGCLAKIPEFGKEREMSKRERKGWLRAQPSLFPSVVKANFSIETHTLFKICFTLCLLSYLCFITGSHKSSERGRRTPQIKHEDHSKRPSRGNRSSVSKNTESYEWNLVRRGSSLNTSMLLIHTHTHTAVRHYGTSWRCMPVNAFSLLNSLKWFPELLALFSKKFPVQLPSAIPTTQKMHRSCNSS